MGKDQPAISSELREALADLKRHQASPDRWRDEFGHEAEEYQLQTRLDALRGRARRAAYAALKESEQAADQQIAGLETKLKAIEQALEGSSDHQELRELAAAISGLVFNLQLEQSRLFRRILWIERALMDAGIPPPRIDEE